MGREQDAKAIFEILVHEHADMLECYLRSHLGNAAYIDDLFQETMLVAWRRIGDYDKTRPFALWLYGIARNLILEQHRKNMRKPLSTDPRVLGELDRRFEMLPHHGREAFTAHTERLFDCITRLPEAMREAIDLVYRRNMTLAHTAQSVGASEEAVKKRVQRARLLLADCLGLGSHGEVATDET